MVEGLNWFFEVEHRKRMARLRCNLVIINRLIARARRAADQQLAEHQAMHGRLDRDRASRQDHAGKGRCAGGEPSIRPSVRRAAPLPLRGS